MRTSHKLITLALVIFLLGGFGGLFMQKYLAPYLADKPVFNKFGIFRTDSPLVITKTEQIRVNENVNLRNLVKALTPQMVLILGGRGEVGRNFEEQTRGSGVILSGDGVIALDNALLLERRPLYVAITSDGEVLPLTFLAADPKSRLALVKVNANNLSAISFGVTGELELGQQLVLLSGSESVNSSNFKDSYVERAPGDVPLSQVSSSEVYQTRFELDVRPTGGQGIFNLNGQLIGIGTTNDGIIPAEAVRSATDAYFKHKKITRPLLGINYATFSNAGAKLLNIGVNQGIILKRTPTGPAALAGLRESDVVYKVNGENIDVRRTPLDIFLDRAKPGDSMKFSVLRAGKEAELTAALGEMK